MGEFEEELVAMRAAAHLSLMSNAFSPCGKLVLAGSNTGKVYIWSLLDEVVVAEAMEETSRAKAEDTANEERSEALIDEEALRDTIQGTEKKVRRRGCVRGIGIERVKR